MKIDLPPNTMTLEEIEAQWTREEAERAGSLLRRVLHWLEMAPSSFKWWLYERSIHPRDIKHGLKNVAFFFKAVWKFRPWDFHHTLVLLERALEAQEKDMRKDVITNAQKYGDDIRLARLLCQRIVKEDYPWGTQAFYLKDRKDVITSNAGLRQKDLDLLTETIRRHGLKWWT